jgi:membrane fusion protein (multidrug efflux system)
MSIRKIITLCCAVSLIVIACSSREKQSSPVQKVAVEVDPVRPADIVITKTFSGTIEGARQSKIFATIPERVISIPVAEGDYVTKGQPIIILNKSGVASQYNQAQAVYLNAKDNYEKMENLYQQKAISEVSYKGAKTAYEVAEANFNAAKAAVELSVPIDGIVTDIAVNVGDQAPLGTAIATVANIEKMRLTIFVGLSEVTKIRIGELADVYVDAANPIKAKIIEVSKSADPDTRLFRIELEMANSQGALKPGMYAKALIVLDKLANVMTVDNRAIYSDEGISKVYIVQNDMAYDRSIEIGPTDGERTQVLNGLSEGQKTVVVGKSSLRDAIPVILSGRKDSTDVPR